MHSPRKPLALLLLLASTTLAQYSSYITFLYSDSHTTVTVSYIYTPPYYLRPSVTDPNYRGPSATPAASVTSAQQSSIESSLSSRLSSSLSTAAVASSLSSAAITSSASTRPAGTTSTGAAGALTTDAARPVSNRRSGLSTGAIIGLSVGLGILGLLLLLGLIFFCCFFLRKKNKRKAAAAAAATQREDEKEGEMSSSDVNVMPSDYPAAGAVLPANYDSREPTLPALSFEKEATSAATFSPLAEPSHGHQPISDAIAVGSGAEAGATVEALANQNKPWAPQGYKPYRASATASPMSEFDFGLGNQGPGSSSWNSTQRQSIPRRPVGYN